MWYLQSAVNAAYLWGGLTFEVHSIRLRNKNHTKHSRRRSMRVWHLACRRQHKTDDGDYDENPTIIEDIIVYACTQTATTTFCGTSSTLLHRTTDIVINISAWDCCNSLWLCALVAQHLKRLAGTKYKIWVHILYSSTAHQSWSLCTKSLGTLCSKP